MPATRREMVRVKSGSKPCSIIRAKASAEIASSEPPVLDDRRMDPDPFVLEERRTLTERDAARVLRFESLDDDWLDDDWPTVDEDCADPALVVEGPLIVEVDVVPDASRLGGNTMGATGRSSIIDLRTAAGRGAVAAR